MKFVRVMNGTISHASGYQFKINEVNVADVWDPAADNPKDFGRFNFTDEVHVLRWMIRGDTLYDVEIPAEAEVIAVENRNTPGGVWRTHQIIVTNPRVITDDLCVELYKTSQLPEKTYFHVLAILAGKGFRKTCEMILKNTRKCVIVPNNLLCTRNHNSVIIILTTLGMASGAYH